MRCYFCGQESTSREHAPPKQLFKGFSCDRITVPSCDLHNTNKSNIDEAIVKAMLYSLSCRKELQSKEVQKVIDLSIPKMQQVKKLVVPMSVIPSLKEINTEVAFLKKEASIPEWIRQISAALMYKKLGYYEQSNNYTNSVVFDSTYYKSGQNGLSKEEYIKQYLDKKETVDSLEQLVWSNGWTSGKNNFPYQLYYFKYHIYDDLVIFRHHFFQNYLIYCMITINEASRNALTYMK